MDLIWTGSPLTRTGRDRHVRDLPVVLGGARNPEISPPPAICKPGILRAAPPESTLGLSHFLGLEHNISHISTTRPVARCFLFLPVSGLGRAAGYLRARKGLIGLNWASASWTVKWLPPSS